MTTSPPPAASDEPDRGFRHWARLFLSLHLPAISMGFGMGATLVVMGRLSQDFGATLGAAIMVFVLQQLGTAVAPVPTGYLIDRFGRRRMLLAGPFVVAASSLLIVRTLVMDGAFAEIIVYRFFTGVGEQMWMLSRLAVIADTGRQQQRGKQITGMFGVQQFGNLAGPIVGGAASVSLGLWVPFAMHAAVVILGVIPSFYLVKETLVRRSASGSAGRAGAPGGGGEGGLTWKDMRTPPIPNVMAAQFLANVTRGGIFGGSVMILYASYAYGMSELYIGSLKSLAGFLGIPITFTAGFIMDRYGRKFTIVPGLMLSGLAMAFLAITDALAASSAVFVAAFMSVHLATSLISGNMQTLGTDVAPAHARGAFFGISRLFAQAGSVVSPAGWGIISSIASYAAAFSFLGGAAFAAAMVIFLGVPETLRKDEKPAQPRAVAAAEPAQPVVP